MWTDFWDMHSGGGAKVVLQRNGTFRDGARTGQDIEHIYIEAPEEEAKVIFYNRFGHNPERVSCMCCGNDYAISTDETLEQVTAYHRHCDFAYINKRTGKELTREEAWMPGKGVKSGYEGKYIERQKEDLRQYVDGAEDEKVWQDYLNQRGSAAKYMTLAQYRKQPNVLIIPASKIKATERGGDVPAEGFVWV